MTRALNAAWFRVNPGATWNAGLISICEFGNGVIADAARGITRKTGVRAAIGAGMNIGRMAANRGGAADRVAPAPTSTPSRVPNARPGKERRRLNMVESFMQTRCAREGG